MGLKAIVLVSILVAAVSEARGINKDVLVPRDSVSEEHKPSLGIVDGRNTTIEDHPYLVSVAFVDMLIGCAGAIVSNRWVVTTAICCRRLQFLPNYPGTIIAGSDDPTEGQVYGYEQIVYHPKYDYNIFTGDYNFCCVQIDGQFKWSSKVKPVKVGRRKPKTGTKLIAAGWGGNNSVEATTYQLREGTMYSTSGKKCKHTFSPYLNFTDRMFCAYNQGKTTLCPGDWADPFVSKGRLYGMFLAGISAYICSSRAYPILLADVTAVAPWIKQTTGLQI